MNEKALKGILRELGIQVAGRSGQWLNFSCPFAPWLHDRGHDSSPSAGAKINEQGVSGYKCFTCKKHGRISGLVRSLEYYNEEKYDGLALKADLADADFAFGEFEDYQDAPDVLQDPLSEAAYGDLYGSAWDFKRARKYLQRRGIGKETVEYLNLGYDPDEERIIFPVRHTDKKLYGFTGRSILKDEDFPYKAYKKVRDYLGLPKRHLILGAEFVKDDDKPIFVVEGLFGYAWLHEIGADEFVYPVALLGSELTKSKADIIKEWNRLTALVFDDDKAGEDGLFGTYDKKSKMYDGTGAIDRLYDHVPLIVPPWPDGKNDPDQLTLKDVQRMMKTSLWYEKGRNKYASKGKSWNA